MVRNLLIPHVHSFVRSRALRFAVRRIHVNKKEFYLRECLRVWVEEDCVTRHARVASRVSRVRPLIDRYLRAAILSARASKRSRLALLLHPRNFSRLRGRAINWRRRPSGGIAARWSRDTNGRGGERNSVRSCAAYYGSHANRKIRSGVRETFRCKRCNVRLFYREDFSSTEENVRRAKSPAMLSTESRHRDTHYET